MTTTALARLDVLPSEVAESEETTARGARLVIVSVVVATVGSLLSTKIGGRFALSNVAQIVALILLLRSAPGLLRRNDVAAMLIALASVLVAAVAMSSIYGYAVAFQHVLFFLLAAAYLFAVYRACADRGMAAQIHRGLQIAIPIALVILCLMLALDLGTGQAKRRLGFDDKSHASVMCCFLAFASLRFLRSPQRLLVACAFFALSLLTISRLPFVFLPAFLLAVLIEYRSIRRAATSAWQVFLAHVAIGSVVAAPFLMARQIGDLFSVFDRVLSPGSTTEASTQAHLLLLEYAARLKIENPWNFLFGVTPGGFSGVTIRSDVDVSAYAAVDPPGWEKFAVGDAPMHSSLGSILLEFPLWVAIGYLVLVMWTFVRLLRAREYVMVLFLVGLIAATTVYSSHNELYFYVAWAALISVAAPVRRRGAGTAAAPVPSTRLLERSLT